MRQIVPHSLWIGHAGDGRDVRRLLDLGIAAVIDLAGNEPPIVLPRDIAYCRFPLADGDGNPVWLISAAVETAARCVRHRVPSLVCCSAGMSRSVGVAAAALAQTTGADPDDCLRGIAATGPCDVCGAFWNEVGAVLRSDGGG